MLALIDTRGMPGSDDAHRPTVLLVAGLRGETMDTPRILVALDQFARSAAAGASGVALSALAASNPDALAGGDWEPTAGNPTDLSQGFPPEGGFYSDETGPENRYLWRWVCYQAPDLLVEVALSDDPAQQPVWEANAAFGAGPVVSALGASRANDDDSLVAALGRPSADSPGVIPALRLTTHWTGLSDALQSLWRVTSKDSNVPASQSRLAISMPAAAVLPSKLPVSLPGVMATPLTPLTIPRVSASAGDSAWPPSTTRCPTRPRTSPG